MRLLAGRVLPFDEDSAYAFAMIAARHRLSGRTIGELDSQIAGIALSRGASLATRNVADFQVSGVELINPHGIRGVPESGHWSYGLRQRRDVDYRRLSLHHFGLPLPLRWSICRGQRSLLNWLRKTGIRSKNYAARGMAGAGDSVLLQNEPDWRSGGGGAL